MASHYARLTPCVTKYFNLMNIPNLVKVVFLGKTYAKSVYFANVCNEYFFPQYSVDLHKWLVSKIPPVSKTPTYAFVYRSSN